MSPSFMRKTMVYLGLLDDEYDEYDDLEDRAPGRHPRPDGHRAREVVRAAERRPRARRGDLQLAGPGERSNPTSGIWRSARLTSCPTETECCSCMVPRGQIAQRFDC